MNKTKRVITKTSLVVFGVFCLISTFCSSDFSSAINAPLSMSATIEPSMTIVFDSDELDINITPSSSGTFGQVETSIWSLCNNPSGCSLYMESDQQLTNGDDVINTLDNRSGGYTPANFTSNRWGISTDGGINYYPVAAMSKLFDIKMNNGDEEETDGIKKDFSFGAKLDLSAAKGQYSTTLNFIAVAAPYMPIDGLTYMQDFATLTDLEKAEVFDSMYTDTQYQLTDSRDGKTYTVAKLADGNIWMTQNLDHNIGDIAGGTYTPADTDIPANWTPSSDAITKATNNTSWGTSSTGYTTPQSYDPGDKCWDGTTRNNNTGSLTNSTISCSDASANIHYSIGNYYNWTAAVAMNDSSGYTAQNTDVDQSICPAGWMLPKGGTVKTGSGSFLYLKDQLGLTAGTSGNIQNTPVFFTYGGTWIGGSGEYANIGHRGHYWTSVVEAILDFSSTSAYPYTQTTTPKFFGNSVRCVLRSSINNLTYMQDFAELTSSQKADVITSMTQNHQYTLKDSRDNKDYYIAKLADGNVWMTQNLDLNITNRTYTSADTDIKTDWTPSSDAITKTTTSWTSTSTAPQSYDPGDLCWNGEVRSDYSGILANSTISCSNTSANKHYSVGNYYNWTAAVAMNDSSSYTTNNTDVDQSICPAGWMLPKSGTVQTGSGSFQYLVNQLGLTAGTSGNIQNAPVFFTYGGYWGGSSYRVGGNGHYLSSVVYSNKNSYILGLISNAQSNLSRNTGGSVRCVSR